jgi:hypothetical protein
MSGYVQTNQAITLPDSVYTVSAADTGKLFLVPVLAVNRVVTLPAVAVGLHFRFLATATLTHTATITAAGLVNGVLLNNNAGATTLVAKNAANSAVMTATAVLGDHVDVYCDGVAWHVSGMSSVAAGLA